MAGSYDFQLQSEVGGLARELPVQIITSSVRHPTILRARLPRPGQSKGKEMIPPGGCLAGAGAVNHQKY